MSKIEVGCRMDAIEIDGVIGVRIEDIRQESTFYRRALIVTTDVGDFRITIRAKTEAPLGVKMPVRITL